MLTISLILRASALGALLLLADPVSRTLLPFIFIAETFFYTRAISRVRKATRYRFDFQQLIQKYELADETHYMPLFNLTVLASMAISIISFFAAGVVYGLVLTLTLIVAVILHAAVITECRDAKGV